MQCDQPPLYRVLVDIGHGAKRATHTPRIIIELGDISQNERLKMTQ